MFKIYLSLNNSKILKTICEIPGCLSTAIKVCRERQFSRSLIKNNIILKSKNIMFHGIRVIAPIKKNKQITVCENHQKQIYKK